MNADYSIAPLAPFF